MKIVRRARLNYRSKMHLEDKLKVSILRPVTALKCLIGVREAPFVLNKHLLCRAITSSRVMEIRDLSSRWQRVALLI